MQGASAQSRAERKPVDDIALRAAYEKDKGNLCHKAGDFQGALECYSSGIRDVCDVHYMQGYFEHQHTKLLATLHSNSSLAHAMLGNFVKAAYQSGAALTAMRPDRQSGYSLMESSQHRIVQSDLQPLYLKVRRRRAAAMESLLNYPAAMANLQCLQAPTSFQNPGCVSHPEPEVTASMQRMAMLVGQGMSSTQPQMPPPVPYCPRDGSLYVCGRVVTWKPFIEDPEGASGVSAGCRTVPIVGAVATAKNGSCKVFLYQGVTDACACARLTVISIGSSSRSITSWQVKTQPGKRLPEGGEGHRAVLAFPSKENLYLACIGSEWTDPVRHKPAHQRLQRELDVFEVSQTDKGINCGIAMTASRHSAPNCRKGAASILSGELLYVFGGTSRLQSGQLEIQNDLWTLNVSTQEWVCLHPGSYQYNGECPRRTSGSAMWAFQGCVYIWSGVVKGPDGTGRDESFDTTEMWVWRGDSWHLVVSLADTDLEAMHYGPCPRHNAGCAVSEGGKAYIVGGRKYSDYYVVPPGQARRVQECILSDIWEFNTVQRQWRQVLPQYGHNMPWMFARDRPVVGVMACGDLVVTAGTSPTSDLHQDLGLWRLQLSSARSAGHADVDECCAHLWDPIKMRSWGELLKDPSPVELNDLTENSEVLVVLRGVPHFPIVHSHLGVFVDVPAALKFPEREVSLISCDSVIASDYNWEIGLLVPLQEWQDLPASARSGITQTLGGAGLTWHPRSICCLQKRVGTVSKDLAIHGLNFGSRDGSPGSFPLCLARNDPFEQLGGIWWGCTHNVIEVNAASDREEICAIEVFQMVKLFSTAKAAEAYHMAFFPAFHRRMNMALVRGSPATDERHPVYKMANPEFWQRPSVMAWPDRRVWTYFEVRLHTPQVATKPHSSGNAGLGKQKTATAAIYAMEKLASDRLQSTTAWCPVQCHSCGARERVSLASSDGVEMEEALAKRIKVCAGCGLVRFCSAACQLKAWPDHKDVCKAGGVPTTSPDDLPCL